MGLGNKDIRARSKGLDALADNVEAAKVSMQDQGHAVLHAGHFDSSA